MDTLYLINAYENESRIGSCLFEHLNTLEYDNVKYDTLDIIPQGCCYLVAGVFLRWFVAFIFIHLRD